MNYFAPVPDLGAPVVQERAEAGLTPGSLQAFIEAARGEFLETPLNWRRRQAVELIRLVVTRPVWTELTRSPQWDFYISVEDRRALILEARVEDFAKTGLLLITCDSDEDAAWIISRCGLSAKSVFREPR